MRAVRPLLALAAITMNSWSSALAQTASFVGDSVSITDGTRRFLIGDVLDSDAISRTIHSVRRAGSDYFLVVGAKEWTFGGAPGLGGNCSLGTEEYLLWLHLRDGKVIGSQTALFRSCRADRFNGRLRWVRGALRCETSSVVSPIKPRQPAQIERIVWTFDPSRPEAGFAETRALLASAP